MSTLGRILLTPRLFTLLNLVLNGNDFLSLLVLSLSTQKAFLHSLISNMQILIIVNAPPPYGGGEIRGTHIARYLSEIEGYVCYCYSRSKASKKSQGRVTFRNISEGLGWIRQVLRLIRIHDPSKLYLSIPKNTSAFLRLFPVLEYANRKGVKVYGELAGARFLFLDRPGVFRSIALRYLHMFHSIRFLGKHIQDYHKKYGFSNTVAFDNGIDESDLKDGDYLTRASSRPLRLLYVGVLNRTKGIPKLIDALLITLKAGVSFTCTFVGEWGDSSLQNEIEQLLAANPSLEQKITFTGRLDSDAIWEEYKKAAILVHPTEWDGQPLTILEAYAMGLCVITTKVGAIPDTVADIENGRLMDDNEPSGIAEAITWYARNPESLAEVMGRNRELFEKRFTLERYLSNVEKWLSAETPQQDLFIR